MQLYSRPQWTAIYMQFEFLTSCMYLLTHLRAFAIRVADLLCLVLLNLSNLSLNCNLSYDLCLCARNMRSMQYHIITFKEESCTRSSQLFMLFLGRASAAAWALLFLTILKHPTQDWLGGAGGNFVVDKQNTTKEQ